MSDQEIVVRFVRNVEQRTRKNRLFHELILGLSAFLVFPVVLKIWDLFSPLKAMPLMFAGSIWMASFGGYVLWRLRHKRTLDEAAASIDRQASLNDEIKTA